MALKTTDLLIYPSRCQTSDVLAGLENTIGSVTAHAEEFLSELEAACLESGIDFAYAASHAANESDFFTSFYFVNRRNGFGIGITGEPGVDGPLFPSYMACAQFFAAELLMKVRKPLGNFTTARQYAPQKYDDVKAIVAGSLGTFPTVERIADLGKTFGPNGRECTWFCDASGAEAIVQKARALIPNVPNQTTGGTPMPTDLNMTKGLIPLPSTLDDIIDVSQRDQSSGCRGYDNLGNRPEIPKFLVLHRSLNGAAQSNSGYFHNECCPALTDLEVIAATGVGRRFVRRGDAPSGWANGVVSAPYGDALAWLNLHNYDLNTVNRDGESVEITGFENDAVSEAAWKWLAQWIASRAHDYGITHETMPLIPSEASRSYITWHTEWTVGTGKLCPWPVVQNYTATLIERARAIMKAAQTTGTGDPIPVPPPTTEYAHPLSLPWFDEDLERGYPTDHVWNSPHWGKVNVYAAMRPYESLRAANRLQGPDTKAEKVGPRTKIREGFRGPYTMTVEGRTFVLTYGRSFIDAGTLTPRVSVRPR